MLARNNTTSKSEYWNLSLHQTEFLTLLNVLPRGKKLAALFLGTQHMQYPI